MNFWQSALAWLLIGVCLLLMLVILLQRGRGGGLAGAFGGGGGSSAFGAKTGDVFTWITVGFAGLFVTLAVVANFVFEPEALASPVAAELVPVDSPVPTPITIPVTAGEGIGGLELLTSDGQVIPIGASANPKVGETAKEQNAKPEGDAPKSESDSGGSVSSGSETSESEKGSEKKPDSGGDGGSTSGDQGDEDPGK